MPAPLPIAAAQPLSRSYDIAANARAHATAIHTAGARVVVFPELSLSGYELAADPLTVDDPRLAPIVAACADTGSLALVGAPVVDGGGAGPAIAMLAVGAGGARVAYRKIHLHGIEAARFAPGSTPAVIEVDGWRLGMAICRDTRFPEHAAGTAALGMDAYVAGVLDHAEQVGVQAERANRVIADHRVWVVTASFAGSTGGGFDHAAGRSRIWNPDGEVVAEAGPEPGGIARATLTTLATVPNVTAPVSYRAGRLPP